MEEQALTPSHPKTRRHFLDLLLGASALGWLVSLAYPIIRYLKPLPQTGPTGPARLTRDESAKLEQNKYVIVPVSGQRVIVLQAPDEQLLRLQREMHARRLHDYVSARAIRSLVSLPRRPLRYEWPGVVRATAAALGQV